MLLSSMAPASQPRQGLRQPCTCQQACPACRPSCPSSDTSCSPPPSSRTHVSSPCGLRTSDSSGPCIAPSIYNPSILLSFDPSLLNCNDLSTFLGIPFHPLPLILTNLLANASRCRFSSSPRPGLIYDRQGWNTIVISLSACVLPSWCSLLLCLLYTISE